MFNLPQRLRPYTRLCPEEASPEAININGFPLYDALTAFYQATDGLGNLCTNRAASVCCGSGWAARRKTQQ